jgi:hypothetical protein
VLPSTKLSSDGLLKTNGRNGTYVGLAGPMKNNISSVGWREADGTYDT